MLLKLIQQPVRNHRINITFALPPADRRMHLHPRKRQYSKAMIIYTSGEP